MVDRRLRTQLHCIAYEVYDFTTLLKNNYYGTLRFDNYHYLPAHL
jgi:hypothetical protein